MKLLYECLNDKLPYQLLLNNANSPAAKRTNVFFHSKQIFIYLLDEVQRPPLRNLRRILPPSPSRKLREIFGIVPSVPALQVRVPRCGMLVGNQLVRVFGTHERPNNRGSWELGFQSSMQIRQSWEIKTNGTAPHTSYTFIHRTTF